MAEDKITVGYESERKKNPWVRISIVSLSLVLGLATATQMFARIFDYSEDLGRNVGHVYFPGMFLYWYWEWGNLYPVEFRVAVSYGMAVSAILMITYLIADRVITQSARGNSKLHGTAHWASPKEVKDCGLLDNDEGVYVGAWKDKKGKLHYLRDNGPSHVLCFAPTRSGKGVGLVLPTLLSWKHSTVVSDLKGELWQLTSGWRKQHANNVVLRFEPGSSESCARWNPLDEVRLGTADETGDIRNLTETIIDPKGKGLEDFWMQSAANLLEAIITHVLYKREREGTAANMQAIAYYLADPDNPDMKLEDKLKEMVEYGHYADGSTHRLVSSMGKAMMAKPENERGSVISTMDSVLGIYKDPVVAKNTAKSDFHIIDIMNAKKPVSLYLITTPDNKDRLCPLLRLLINMMLKKLAAKVDYKDGRTVMAHKRRLLMMLDEFPSFGKLQPIADGLAFVAGYGIKIYLISQDTVQFDSIYTDKNSIISNCHIQVMFPPNRLETAKYISQMLGETTVVERQYSVSGKRAGMLHGQVTESMQANKRPLLTPDEVMALPGPKKNSVGDIEQPGEMIIRVAGAAPIRGRQPLYFFDDVFLARAKVPAPIESDTIGVELREVTVVTINESPGKATPKPEEKKDEVKVDFGKLEESDGSENVVAGGDSAEGSGRTSREVFRGATRSHSPKSARVLFWSELMKSPGSRFFARASRVFAIGGILVLLLVLLLYACGARINRTNSLPKGIYCVVKKTPERGDIVTFWPSDCAEMRLARERGYIFDGAFNRAGGVGYGLLMKRFLGLPGDVVSVTDDGIVINGTLVPNTKPLLRDNIGDPLPYLRFTDYTLKENEALFVSDHMPRSYDARYFGVQEIHQIVDVLVPVYVW